MFRRGRASRCRASVLDAINGLRPDVSQFILLSSSIAFDIFCVLSAVRPGNFWAVLKMQGLWRLEPTKMQVSCLTQRSVGILEQEEDVGPNA
jgi:hypothetical protein